MQLPAPLIAGTLVRRYKRFLADVALADGRTITVHCPNSGSMMGLSAPGLPVWLSVSANPNRRYAHTLELVGLPEALVGINTGRPNALVAEAIASGTIAELAGFAGIRREVRYGRNSRVDLVLDSEDGRLPCYVEVKNVHLRRQQGPYPSAAEFPDCVTARGAKHMRELADQVVLGARAAVVFLVQRGDCDHFRVAVDIDPLYHAALAAAMAAGVDVLCYACRLSTDAIVVDRRLPVVL